MHEPAEHSSHAPEAHGPASGTHVRESNMNMDDINIPLVAVSVAFFGALLAVTIISLQAWFYHRAAAEITDKTLARDDIHTELGALWHKQRAELNGPEGWVQLTTMPATATATGTAATVSTQTAPAPRYHVPIEDAMKMIAQEYTGGGAR